MMIKQWRDKALPRLDLLECRYQDDSSTDELRAESRIKRKVEREIGQGFGGDLEVEDLFVVC